MSSSHSHGASAHEVSTTTARLLRAVTLACAVVIAIGVVVLWPSGDDRGVDPMGLAAEPLDAHVVLVEELPCTGDEASTCRFVSFELKEGENKGTFESLEQAIDSTIEQGDDIEVTATRFPDGTTSYSFYEFQRSESLVVLGILFVAAVLILGRWRGLGALAGLAISLAVIVWFALPSLVDGNDAVAVALVTAAVVALAALYLAHGFGPATDVALLSTYASLALTGVLAWLFVRAANFTGFTDDATFMLQSLGTGIDPRGILLAGIVIGSLGVLDDVTVTQVSAVWELHSANPDAGRARLFASALRIGRDHVSSAVNTLFLAYAGAALPLLLLFSEVGAPAGDVATREIVATEIVRALVGSIGLIASVPISTWLAITVVTAGHGNASQPERERARSSSGR